MTVDPTQPVITAVGLLALKKLLQDHGIDWRRSLEEVGIDPDMAIDTDAVVPLQSAFELLENSAQHTGDEAFGLHLGESFPVNIAGALAYVTLNAPDLRTFCRDSARFLGLVTYGYTSRFEEGDAMSYLIHEIPHHLGPRTQFIDMVFAASARRLRHVAQNVELPLHFDTERPAPRKISEFHRVLGTRVRFDQNANRVGIYTSLLSKPLPASDPELYRIVRHHAEEKIDRREKTRSLVYSVTDYITDALKHGDATLPEAAETLGMSARALQRELEKANTTFRDLVEETRKSLARHFLYDTSLPLTEIAFMLGFSELSAFSRAARGWFGVSPRELRKVGSEKARF
jgi:AraC-like DNA-binding protein